MRIFFIAYSYHTEDVTEPSSSTHPGTSETHPETTPSKTSVTPIDTQEEESIVDATDFNEHDIRLLNVLACELNDETLDLENAETQINIENGSGVELTRDIFVTQASASAIFNTDVHQSPPERSKAGEVHNKSTNVHNYSLREKPCMDQHQVITRDSDQNCSTFQNASSQNHRSTYS